MAYNDYDALVSGDDDVQGVIGMEEIVGALEEIVGADKARGVAKLAALRAAGGVGVKPVRYDKSRIQPAPFAATAVAAGATQTITVQPQRLIQILSCVIPSATGTLFTINDIRVGQQTQYITTGVILAQVFSEVADGDRSRMRFDTANVGNLVAIDVTNLDAVNAQTIRPVFFATAVYG